MPGRIRTLNLFKRLSKIFLKNKRKSYSNGCSIAARSCRQGCLAKSGAPYRGSERDIADHRKGASSPAQGTSGSGGNLRLAGKGFARGRAAGPRVAHSRDHLLCGKRVCPPSVGEHNESCLSSIWSCPRFGLIGIALAPSRKDQVTETLA